MTVNVDRQRLQSLAAASRTARTRADILAVIDRAGPDGVDTGSLARRSGYSRNTVLRACRALAADGRVSRRHDPTDNRVIRYRRLTEGAQP